MERAVSDGTIYLTYDRVEAAGDVACVVVYEYDGADIRVLDILQEAPADD